MSDRLRKRISSWRGVDQAPIIQEAKRQGLMSSRWMAPQPMPAFADKALCVSTLRPRGCVGVARTSGDALTYMNTESPCTPFALRGRPGSGRPPATKRWRRREQAPIARIYAAAGIPNRVRTGAYLDEGPPGLRDRQPGSSNRRMWAGNWLLYRLESQAEQARVFEESRSAQWGAR